MTSHRCRPAALLALSVGTLLLVGCSGGGTSAAPTAASTHTAVSAAAQQQVLAALRQRITPPALPSFTLPTDLLTTTKGERAAHELDLQPGLYQGIAVLDAVCDAHGQARAADVGATRTGAGHADDGQRSITVTGDGTGVYDAPGLHIAVLAGGSGVYDDGAVRLQVQADRSGTWTTSTQRLTVKADGSGSYQDATTRLWVGPDGSGGYDDDDTHVSVSASGEVRSRGDHSTALAAAQIIHERLPLFAPVPGITRVQPTGTVCGTVVRLDTSVLFDFDSAALRPSAASTLARVAALLAALGHPAVRVDGYTDSEGTASYNQELSLRRAQAVAQALHDDGVPDHVLTAAGHGEADPVQPEHRADGSVDPAAQAANRRVELLLPGA